MVKIFSKKFRISDTNFNGYHYDLAWFNGQGGDHVPAWTPYIYRWSSMPNLYLVERASNAGSAIWSLKVGQQVIINGKTYTIYKYSSGVNNANGDAYELVTGENAPVAFQTCETSNEWSTLSFWFAR